MKLDLDKIEADARAALNKDFWFGMAALLEVPFDASNATHIENCDPPTVLAMIARIRELEAQRKDFINDVEERWAKAEGK